MYCIMFIYVFIVLYFSCIVVKFVSMSFLMYVPLHLCMISLYFSFPCKGGFKKASSIVLLPGFSWDEHSLSCPCPILSALGNPQMPNFPGHLRPKKRRWVTLRDGISNEVDVAQVSKLEADRADEFSSVTGVFNWAPLFRKRCQNMKNHGKINQKDGISKWNLSSLVLVRVIEF